MDPATIGLALKVVTTLYDRWITYRREKAEREAEAEILAAEVAAVYEVVRDGLQDIPGLFSEWRAKVRTLSEIMLPLRARIDFAVEAVGNHSGRMKDKGHRELVIASVIAMAAHEVFNDDDIIPLVDDTEAIRLAISAATRVWRSGRDAGSRREYLDSLVAEGGR